MSGRFSSAVFALLGMFLLPAAAQQPAPQPPQQSTDQSIVSSQPVAPGVVPNQPQSQPGAQGQLLAITQPPLPVPPGPVPPEEIEPAPPTPIAIKKVELGSTNTWDPQWDVLIEENLPPELLSPDISRDVRPFCPRFGSLSDADKRAFWAYMFQALAGAEAGLRPTADVRHTDPTIAIRDKVTHRTARQEGLMQVRYEDADRYGCDFDWEADKHLPVHDPGKTILQPENNLMCGLRIMKHQLIDKDEPLLTRKSYWGTLHPGTAGYRVFARQMENVPAACGAHTAHSVKHHQPELRQASASQPSGATLGGADE